MKKNLLLIISLCFYFSLTLNAQNSSDETELKKILHNFMDGASKNDSLIHANFWAEELIYTSSNGTRFGKKEIIGRFNSNKESKIEIPSTIIQLKDHHIQQFCKYRFVDL